MPETRHLFCRSFLVSKGTALEKKLGDSGSAEFFCLKMDETTLG